ncbi:MAG: acyl carrier protein [Acidimicrobiales bacterium]
MADVRGELQRFVNNSLGSDLATDANVFDNGATSLFAIELVTFIEKTFGVQLDDADLEPENFSSVDAMTLLSERKLAASASPPNVQ